MKKALIERFVDYLCTNKIINVEEREIYTFGLNQGFNAIFNILLMIAIGFSLGMFWQSIIFILCYLPLRQFAGGYHASTERKCFFLSILMFVSVLMVVNYIPWTNFIIILLNIISCIIIFTLVPVEDFNKPLDEIEIAKYRKSSINILLINIFISTILLIFTINIVSITISISLFSLSIMLVLGKIKNTSINKTSF